MGPDVDDVTTAGCRATYDSIAVDYARTNAHGPTGIVAKLLHSFIGLLPQGAIVLDAGSGVGQDMRLMAQAGLRPVGVDLSYGMISHARGGDRTGGLAPCAQGSLTHLPFRTASFAGAWSSFVFAHLTTREKYAAAHQIGRVLQPGAAFFVLTAAGEGHLDEPVPYRPGLTRAYHLQDELSLVRLAHQIGFTVRHIASPAPEPGRRPMLWAHLVRPETLEDAS